MSETPHPPKPPDLAATEAYDELPPRLLRKLKVSVPGYKLQNVIARGGQAIVIKAIQQATGKAVAIKLLREGPLADSAARGRLQREVAVMATLDHPNIVTVIDSGVTPEGLDYLAMNFVAGQPLHEFMDENRAGRKHSNDAAALLRLFIKICQAINAAHLRGIVHRDLSPSNIMVDDDGEPHILDFGLARTAFDRFITGGDRTISITGQFIGKLAYASPEQARGEADKIDIRTDVYALGVILYQILTGGEFPYKVVGNVVEVLGNIVNEVPTPPSKRIEARDADKAQRQRRLRKRHPPAVNAVMEAIVLKALEKDADNRYQSAGEFGRDIENYLAGQPTVARIAEGPITRLRFSLSRWMPKSLPRFSLPRLSLPKFTAWQLALAALVVGLVFSGWAIVHFLSTEQPSLIPTDPINGQSIDLLSQIQLPKSALLGNWKRSADGIESDDSAPAKLQLPYAPIGEYDFRITFTRKSGDQPVMQLLSTNGKRIAWMMGGWQNSVSGFGMVDGASADQNASACPLGIVNGQKYAAEIRVRQHSVSAYLDGVLVSSLSTNDANLTVPELLAISEGSLGLATHKSPTIFHSIEVVPRAK